MKYWVLSIALLSLASCREEPTVVGEANAAPALNPWEPIDPGFAGCEGG